MVAYPSSMATAGANKGRRQRRVPGGRSGRLVVKVTEQARAELADRAATAGLSVQRYVMECALRSTGGGWSLSQQYSWSDRLDLVETRLNRIGGNLNQLAAAANAGAAVDEQVLAAAVAYHVATLQQLRRLLADLPGGGP